MANPYGDVELDVKGARALAHPVRVRILFELRTGPATATILSTKVGASPSVTSWHLRHLAEHGLVEDAPGLGHGRERWWRTVGAGFRVVVEDDAGQDAAAALQAVLDEVNGDPVGEWRRDVAPRLEAEFRRLAISHDTLISVTAGELAAINASVEALLAPYVRRDHQPDGARSVRILRQVLPSLAEQASSEVGSAIWEDGR